MKTFVLVLALLAVTYAAEESTNPHQIQSDDNKGPHHNGVEDFFHKAKEFVETKGPEIAEDLGSKFNSFKHYIGDKFHEDEHHHHGGPDATTESSTTESSTTESSTSSYTSTSSSYLKP